MPSLRPAGWRLAGSLAPLVPLAALSILVPSRAAQAWGGSDTSSDGSDTSSDGTDSDGSDTGGDGSDTGSDGTGSDGSDTGSDSSDTSSGEEASGGDEVTDETETSPTYDLPYDTTCGCATTNDEVPVSIALGLLVLALIRPQRRKGDRAR